MPLPPSLIIRRARPDDVHHLMAMAAQPSVRAGMLLMPYPELSHWADWPGRSGTTDLVLVAEVDGRAVGHALLSPEEASPARRHVRSLALGLLDDYQGQGIGAALMAALIDYCDRWLNVGRLELTAFSANEAALALYRRFGFEVERRMHGDAFRAGGWPDSLTMARFNPAWQWPEASAAAFEPAAPLSLQGELALRRATLADAEPLAAMFDDLATVSGTTQMPYANLTLWQQRLSQSAEGRLMLVAEQGGAVVGCAGLHADAHGEAREHVRNIGLTVAPGAQGRGIGRRLLAELVDYADNWANIARLMLTVYTDNAAAIHLYRSLGFVMEGTHKRYAFRNGQWKDAHAMARLSPRFSRELDQDHK